MFGNKVIEETEELVIDINKPIKPYQATEEVLTINVSKRNISENKKAELREMYKYVVVNDFDDEYHLSEQERELYDKNHRLKKLVSKQKQKYSNIVDFIKAYRNCLTVLEEISNTNGIYSKEQFMKMVLKNKLYVSGLVFPKFIRKKSMPQMNWDFVAEFLVNPDREDYDILLKSSDDGNDDEEYMKNILSEEDKDLIDTIVEIDRNITPDIFVDEIKKKELKNILRNNPSMALAIKEIKRSQINSKNLSAFAYSLSYGDLEYLESLDNKRGIHYGEMPKFKGSMMNKDDVDRYIRELTDWENEHTTTTYRGRTKTLDEVKLLQIKDDFEKAGWNVRKFYPDVKKKENAKFKKAKKKLAKKQDDIKKKLIGDSIKKEKEIKSKKKKNKKKGK